jgi:hypothetical protein
MLEAIEEIGAENLEDIALRAYKPRPGIYIFVSLDGKIIREIRNERRIYFNTKYRMMDYYSWIVSMQKPVKSKLIFSNNYLAFFCKNAQKLTDADIDEYFQRLETPEDHMFFANVIKNNIRKIKKEDQDIVKFFLMDSPELYRELGMKDWREKSISMPPKSGMTKEKWLKGKDRKGYPMGCSYNAKKPGNLNRIYVVNEEEGLQIKLFYDILKGFFNRGCNIAIVGKNMLIPLKSKQGIDRRITGAMLIWFTMRKGQIVIVDIDRIASYDPVLRYNKN